MDVAVLPGLARVREQVLDVDGPVRMAHEMHRPVPVLAVGLLDEPLRTTEEAGHVRGEPGVVAGDTDVHVAGVAGGLEGLVHRLVGGGAGREPVVRDCDGHAGLLREAQAHGLAQVAVVAQGRKLVAADLVEGAAGITEDEVFEGPGGRAVRVGGLVSNSHGQACEVPGREEDDGRQAFGCRSLRGGRARHQGHEKDRNERHAPKPAQGASTKPAHGSPPRSAPAVSAESRPAFAIVRVAANLRAAARSVPRLGPHRPFQPAGSRSVGRSPRRSPRR